MKVKVEDSGPCRKTLSVELPVETVNSEYEKVAKSFAAAASVPGYRKGKAPQTLVERHYKKPIMEEVKDGLVFESYRAALKEKEINPVAVLDLADVSLEPGRPMTYKVVLDVPPQFKLPKYKKISVKPRKVEISDEQVQQQLNLLLERLAEYKAVEDRPLQHGDLARIDYEGFSEGAPLAAPDKASAALARGRGFWTALEKDAFIPGFEEGLAGMKKGDTKDINVVFPTDSSHAALAGKTAVYRVTVQEIREKILPEINDEFLKKMESDSEDALRAKLREMLEAQESHGERERLKTEIIENLLKNTSLDVPKSLLAEEARNVFVSLVRENIQRGVSREKLDEEREKLLNHASESAEKRIKTSYILHRIAEAENIGVEQSELDQEIKNTASRMGVDTDTVRRKLEERQEMDTVRNRILADKTLDFLLENAATEETGIFSRIMKSRK